MPNLHDAIAAADLDQIRARLSNWSPPVVASEIRTLTPVEQALVIRVLPRKNAAATFEFLDR